MKKLLLLIALILIVTNVSACISAADVKEVASLVTEHKILPFPEVLEKAIPACNVRYIDGEQMKAEMSTFIDLIFDGNPKAFGGKKPDDAFYYIK